MRYLSDEEKIRAVFNVQNNRTDLLTYVVPLGPKYEYIEYESFEEYLAENPNCCRINPGGPYEAAPSSFWDRIIFGYDSGDMVVVDFKVRYLDKSGNRGFKEVRFDNQLSNCGDKVH